MLKCAFLAACLLLPVSAGATEIVLKNADFEQVMTGGRIPGWSKSQHAGVRAYEVSSDKDHFAKGKYSIRILRTTEQAYGLISQRLETPGLGGKQVELIAALKSEGVGKKGWVMVLTFKNHSDILDQVRTEPVTGDKAWTDVRITKLAPPQTSHVEVGFLLLDGGTGWVDNVRLRTLDEVTPTPNDAPSESSADNAPVKQR